MTSPAVIKYEPFRQVMLFGGTPLIGKLAKLLRDHYEVSIYTAPRQAGDVPDIEGVKRIVTADINESLEAFEVSDALGIGMGQAWRYGPELCAAFGNRLVDFMSIPYPSYLGGAHVSHAILRGEKHWGCCMQLVTPNTVQGEVHDGDVIYGREMPFPDHNHHRALDDVYLDFLYAFVANAHAGYLFQPDATTFFNRFPRFHFPRLNTERQGWVDWSWRRLEVLRFIQAFDAPYPGARTILHDGTDSKVVTLHDAIDFGIADSHPFQAGLITAVADGRATVALSGGPIAVTIRDDQIHTPAWIRPGMRLHTDRATLDKAMTYSPQYTPQGDMAHATRD